MNRSRLALFCCLLIIPAAVIIQSCQPIRSAQNGDGLVTVVSPSLEADVPPVGLTEFELPSGFGARNTWLEIYFTNPDSPLASQETGGLDEVLVSALDSARLSVDLAVYSFSLRNVRDALIRAHERGTQVRVVMESDNQDNSALQAILEAGIPVLGDRREGLMHDKFLIIDRSEVFLGSMNYTYSGVYTDNNALIRIRSEELAENYLTEFNEMFEADNFGSDSGSQTPHPEIEIEGTRIEALYSPEDGIPDHLLSILRKAQESIYFMAFSFTDDELGDAIRSRAAKDILVGGVMDASQVNFNIGTEYDLFKQADLNVFLDGNEGQMHHKTMIVDEEIVITGSYNFTRSAATRNDENLLIIYDPQIADFFIQEFQRIYSQAEK
jgi:phosphatidylserine/phosphatidylglycerophosphate/cardiolipin synthase-like enzyme